MMAQQNYSVDDLKLENVEIDDSEYHQDFTTASDWEILTSGIEEILHSWKLTTPTPAVKYPPIAGGTWDQKSEILRFVDMEFKMTWHFLIPESTVPENPEADEDKHYIFSELEFKNDDFPALSDEQSGLTLARIYGVHNFLVITPPASAEIDNESKVKILLSSVCMAANSCGCELPIFVQIRENWQQLFIGVCESRGMATNFDMIHLQKGPQHCKYMNGLIDVFKGKIASSIPLDTIRVSVQFSYSLVLMNKFEFRRREVIGVDQIGSLQLGACLDPFSEMTLLATWQNIPEYMVVDSQNHSDFDPQRAASWSIRIKMVETPACLLSDCILEFLNLTGNNSTLSDLLGDLVVDSNNDTLNALNRITESKVPSFTNVLRRATSSARDGRKRSRSSDGPLSEEFLIPILYFLFPDAEANPKRPYLSESEHPPESGAFKSSGFDSLVWRLAIVLAQSGHSMGGARSVAYVWYEFVQEMRYRWERSIKIPGLAPGFPDFRTSLLHQKLQLLNCCIERKVKRESGTDDKVYGDEQNISTDSDEEFFDCGEESNLLWTEPIGRHTKFGNLKLIETGDPLYIPITQDAVPKTEDQLEEDADVLVQLGNDAMGSELRARMMSASLLSDMESFKAANPHGIFEDFIRWYSPRDWIDEESSDQWGQSNGHLSSRMQIKDNTWIVVWESAKPVPARRQKRLFDDTREAEKVLHFLESRTVSQVVDLLLPVLTHVCVCFLLSETQKNDYVELPTLSDMLRHLIKVGERVSRDSCSNLNRYETIFQEISAIETLIAKAESLRRNFYEVNRSSNTEFINFFGGVLQKREMVVPDGPGGLLGDKICKMFHDVYKHFDVMNLDDSAHGDEVHVSNVSPFPSPEKKEYVMRTMAKRPLPYSKMSPQLMRAILTKDDFRLAGAFSQDTLFF